MNDANDDDEEEEEDEHSLLVMNSCLKNPGGLRRQDTWPHGCRPRGVFVLLKQATGPARAVAGAESCSKGAGEEEEEEEEERPDNLLCNSITGDCCGDDSYGDDSSG